MKKKNLSFMTLFMLTASLIGGCSCNKQSNENVNDLVLKVGDKEYSAKDLYNELISNGTGANEAFAKVFRLVVESSMETTSNIQAAADLAAESFEKEVENDSLTNGTSKDESREKLLKDKGYVSVDEMKADIIYNQKLTRINESYWEAKKSDYFDGYMAERLPYLVRHVLVKIDDSNANKIANNVAISAGDGEKLFDVIKRFEAGDKFAYVANQESEDSGSTASGGAYYMDNTYGVNGFVDEFVYGTYALDAYTTKVVDGTTTSYTYGANQDKLSKLRGLADTETFAKYYENGFNFVDMAYVNILGEVYNQTTQSDRDYFDINAYNKVEKENDEIAYESATGNLNSEENAYARNIIFNRVFNKPGVSVIGYNSEQDAIDAGAKNYVELKLSATESKYVLTDEKGNIIFFVAARGSESQLWIHFLTINVSSLDNFEEAKKFFSMNPDSTDDFVSYVEMMNTTGTTAGANSVIDEIEGYVKSYATYGNGSSIGEESVLKLDMLEYYMAENEITFASTELENAIKTYAANKKRLLRTKLENSISDDWDTHTNKLGVSMADWVKKGIKPFECAVLLPQDLDSKDNPYTVLSYNTDSLCRYVYGEGYEVQLIYSYQTGDSASDFTRISKTETNRAYFDDESNYVQWVKIGAKYELPTPKVAAGYKFEGWFTDKGLTKEVTKENGKYVTDLTTSSMYNNTLFFAKIVAFDTTTINYTYKYADGTTVGTDLAALLNEENTNVKSQKYSSTGNNTITFATFTSDYVTVTDFSEDSITLSQDNEGQTVEIVVTVEPKTTTINYIYLNEDLTSLDGVENTNPTSATYSTTTNNSVVISNSNFAKDGYKFTSKYIRGEVASADIATKYAETTVVEGSITLEEIDMGQTITVFVVGGEE